MNNTKSIGNSADGQFKVALKARESSVKLETFYNAVNQASSSNCCSCCSKETLVYAVKTGLLPIKPTIINLCGECLASLPNELSVINLNSIWSPPLLIYKTTESEV